MYIRLSRDLLSAMFFIGLGATAIWLGADYPMGNAANMGAGYFPMISSIGLILIGAIVLLRSFTVESEPVGEVALRPLMIVVASIALFTLLVDEVGFIPAGIVLVIGSSLAGERRRWIEVVLLALGLVLFCYLLFVWALGLNLPRGRFW